jgi:hypothetical protein
MNRLRLVEPARNAIVGHRLFLVRWIVVALDGTVVPLDWAHRSQTNRGAPWVHDEGDQENG